MIRDKGLSRRKVRFGSKADMRGAIAHVRFTPNSDIKCAIWESQTQTWMAC
jgi:hypothetical protein